MGSVRHVADIRADDVSMEGAGVIGLQAGKHSCLSPCVVPLACNNPTSDGARHACEVNPTTPEGYHSWRKHRPLNK